MFLDTIPKFKDTREACQFLLDLHDAGKIQPAGVCLYRDALKRPCFVGAFMTNAEAKRLEAEDRDSDMFSKLPAPLVTRVSRRAHMTVDQLNAIQSAFDGGWAGAGLRVIREIGGL